MRYGSLYPQIFEHNIDVCKKKSAKNSSNNEKYQCLKYNDNQNNVELVKI